MYETAEAKPVVESKLDPLLFWLKIIQKNLNASYILIKKLVNSPLSGITRTGLEGMPPNETARDAVLLIKMKRNLSIGR